MTKEQGDDETREGKREEDEESIRSGERKSSKKEERREESVQAMDENERIKEEGSVCCALANEERGQQDLDKGPTRTVPFFDPTPTVDHWNLQQSPVGRVRVKEMEDGRIQIDR